MVTQYSELTDFQWANIEDIFDNTRRRRHSLRLIVNAILYLNRAGCQWRNLPKEYPKWQLVYYYFRLWSKDGTIERPNFSLNWEVRKLSGREPTPSMCCADSQSVKLAPMVKQARGIDGNKKINGRKRQALTDTMGLIWAVFVHAANAHGSLMGCGPLEHTKVLFRPFEQGAY